jgi:hypothetical protein
MLLDYLLGGIAIAIVIVVLLVFLVVRPESRSTDP